jgi:uncharacterized membrane protein
MEKRPILQLRLTKFDYLLEFLAIGILVFHWIFMLNYYCKLPLIIPSHIDSNGEIDGMGPKGLIFLLPTISILMYILISVVNKKPHCFNFPYPITAENAERQYRNSLMMNRVMKMLVQLVFLFVTANIISTALPFGLKFVGLWMFPFGISLVFICMFFFVFRGFKLK